MTPSDMATTSNAPSPQKEGKIAPVEMNAETVTEEVGADKGERKLVVGEGVRNEESKRRGGGAYPEQQLRHFKSSPAAPNYQRQNVGYNVHSYNHNNKHHTAFNGPPLQPELMAVDPVLLTALANDRVRGFVIKLEAEVLR